MTRYSIQPRDGIFIRNYDFLFFVKNMSKYVGKNICKNLSSKYNQKSLDHANKSVTNAIKSFSKRVIRKTTEAAYDLIGNKIA